MYSSIEVVLSLLVLKSIHAAPVDPKKNTAENVERKPNFDLDYNYYLQEVAKLLENDKGFAERLRNIPQERLQNGNIAEELEFVKHNVRTQLDELKRRELDRIRNYAVKQMEINELGIDRKRIKIPNHLDLNNPHSFEVEDLKKLISATYKDIQEINEKRRNEFKHYEMEKEHAFREKLHQLNETEQQEVKKKHEELVQKHKEHPKVHHPGSKPQLEEVWEEDDHLPKDEFDPKVFFSMHDLNGDNFLDQQEIEAILTPEIKKMYDENNEEDDPIERMEEFARMTEHIFNETDHNRDGLISREEFFEMTGKKDFETDEGWKGLDEELPFTDEELEEYERLVKERKQEILGNKEEGNRI